MKTIGERICHLRKLFRMTQSELAKKIYCSDKVISKWENNESEPDLKEVTALSQLFGVTSDYLISGKATQQDEVILSKKPSEEELITDAKESFIKQCNAIIRNGNLYKYKDKIFPNDMCEVFMGQKYDRIKRNFIDVGIFHPIVSNKTEPYEAGINLKSLLALDDYNLFEKIIALNIPFCDENEVIRFTSKNKLLSDKDVHGLTDVRFYSFLSDQTALIKQSYERETCKDRRYSFTKFLNDNGYKNAYKKILSEALNKLERNHPNYWEIVKVLIEKGAFVQKMVGVHYGEYGDIGLYMDYADDNFVTDLIYEQACEKCNK